MAHRDYGSLVLHAPDKSTYTKLEKETTHWRITATPDITARIKRIFPRSNATRAGYLAVADTQDVARDLEWILSRWPLTISDEDLKHLTGRADAHREVESVREFILAGGRLEGNWLEPARPCRDYQTTAVDMMIAQKRMILTDSLGLGKTQSAIAILKDPNARPCVVVTMTHLTHQWQRECNAVWPELKTHIVKKGSYYDLSKVCEGEHPDIVIMNYAKLAGWSNHLAGWAKSVIFDEGQELRTGVSTAKGSAAAHIAEQATYAVSTTASPVYNYGSEIFNIIDILHKDALGTHAEFSREWGLSYDGKRVQDPAALGAYLKDQGFMMGRTRKEVGRELGEEPQRITYSVDSDEHVLEHIAGDAIAMAQMLLSDTEEADAARFRVAGELDWKLRQATGIAKAPYVAEFVRLLLQSEQKIVLFGWHKAVYEIWAEKLAEFNPVFYTGEESPAQKEKSLQAFSGEFTDDTPWRERKESRVIIISLRAGAGLDGLQKHASVCVFGELDWSPEVHTQGIGRLYRDGQEDLVMAYFMVSDHGADPVMAEVLEDKRQQSEFIVRPEGQKVTHVANTRDHMRKLAEDILKRNNVALPEPTMTADEKMDRAKERRKERAKERAKQTKK